MDNKQVRIIGLLRTHDLNIIFNTPSYESDEWFYRFYLIPEEIEGVCFTADQVFKELEHLFDMDRQAHFAAMEPWDLAEVEKSENPDKWFNPKYNTEIYFESFYQPKLTGKFQDYKRDSEFNDLIRVQVLAKRQMLKDGNGFLSPVFIDPVEN